MKINVSYGETINTGNYESKKIQIGIEKEYPDRLFSDESIERIIKEKYNTIVKITQELIKETLAGRSQ